MAPVNASEASGLRENLIEGLNAFWRGLDEAITFTNKKHETAAIWSIMPDEDTEYLVDSMLRIAQRVPAAAAAVRALANASHQLRLGTILIPRFVAMWQFYSAAGGFAVGGWS